VVIIIIIFGVVIAFVGTLVCCCVVFRKRFAMSLANCAISILIMWQITVKITGSGWPWLMASIAAEGVWFATHFCA